MSDTSYTSALDNTPQALQYDFSFGSPVPLDKFSVVHYNINSITAEGRLEALTDVCKTLNISVLILTETKLHANIPNNILTIPGYHEPIRQDRLVNGRHGGGTMMFISETLTYKHQDRKQSKHYEHLWVDILTQNKVIAINAFYRPPNESAESHTHFIETSTSILQSLSQHDADVRIVSSDLNFGNCFCVEPILPFKPLDNAASQVFSSFGFTEVIDVPTRVTTDTTSLIDLVFVDSLQFVEEFGTLPQIADHDGTLLCLNITQQHKHTTQKKVFDYKNADIDGLIKFIKEFDFNLAVFSFPIKDQPKKFTDTLKTILKTFVPEKTICLKPNSIPWCNTYTRLLLRKKNRNYKIYKKASNNYSSAMTSGTSQPIIITQLLRRKNKTNKNFKIASKESLKANRRVKSAFFNSVNATMVNNEISAKKKFSILTKLMSNQKFSSITSLIENGQLVDDSQSKSNLLNSHFANKSTVINSDDDVPHLDQYDNISPFYTINTSNIEISKIIRSLKKSNFSHCGIPGKFLAFIATPISFSLSQLINNQFEVGLFPDIWKTSHITALYKHKGSKSDKNNYRPISLLPTLSKVCESVMHKRLLDHCMDHNIISSKQAAYLKGDSTIAQLLYIVHKIRSQWTKGNITHGVFLDVQAAFDKVWHKGLLAKLKQINITDKAHELFTSYLSKRTQVTVVDNYKSDVKSVKAGVPQGSRLGPLLFIIYINDITANIESDILIFADDTSLLVSGKSPEETTKIINRDLERISCWSAKWKVTFNADKSKQILFSKNTFNLSPLVTLNNKTIKLVDSHKHLGLHLTFNLDWSTHIYNVCLKANRKLAILRQVKLLKRHTLDVLYKLTVRSVIDYALPVYYHTLKLSQKALLDKVQYTAAKIVTGALHLTSTDKLNQELGWETIGDRADLLGSSVFHKICKGETRELIKTCLQPKVICQQTLRFGGFVPFPFYNLPYSNSFFPYFTKKYNKLNNKITSLTTADFKQHISSKLKPYKNKHFSCGNKSSNMLLTRIRVGRSLLKTHSHSIGLSDTNTCTCNDTTPESPIHYITQCPRYMGARQTLYDQVEQNFIPNFRKLSLKKQLDILIFGYEPFNPEMRSINNKIMILTQKYIFKTKRFEQVI